MVNCPMCRKYFRHIARNKNATRIDSNSSGKYVPQGGVLLDVLLAENTPFRILQSSYKNARCKFDRLSGRYSIMQAASYHTCVLYSVQNTVIFDCSCLFGWPLIVRRTTSSSFFFHGRATGSITWLTTYSAGRRWWFRASSRRIPLSLGRMQGKTYV